MSMSILTRTSHDQLRVRRMSCFLTFQTAALIAGAESVARSTNKLRAAPQHLTDSLQIRLKMFRFIHNPDTPHEPLAILALSLNAHCSTKLEFSSNQKKKGERNRESV